MGFSRGSDIFSGVIAAVKPVVKNIDDRKAIYRQIIDVLNDADWDTQDECLGRDEAYDELYYQELGYEDDW